VESGHSAQGFDAPVYEYTPYFPPNTW